MPAHATWANALERRPGLGPGDRSAGRPYVDYEPETRREDRDDDRKVRNSPKRQASGKFAARGHQATGAATEAVRAETIRALARPSPYGFAGRAIRR